MARPRLVRALWFFVIHLLFNGLWSWLFFHWRLGGVAFAEILLLWVMITALVLWFRQIRPMAAALLLPYWAWTTFAAALNFDLWRRNPGLL